VKWTLGLLWSSLSVLKLIAYVWRPNCDIGGANKNRVLLGRKMFGGLSGPPPKKCVGSTIADVGLWYSSLRGRHVRTTRPIIIFLESNIYVYCYSYLSKSYRNLRFQSGMANSHFSARSFCFGDIEQTRTRTVFLATDQQTVVLRVNTRKGIQRFSMKCRIIRWKHKERPHSLTLM
jgi:hypothetical protein